VVRGEGRGEGSREVSARRRNRGRGGQSRSAVPSRGIRFRSGGWGRAGSPPGAPWRGRRLWTRRRFHRRRARAGQSPGGVCPMTCPCEARRGVRRERGCSTCRGRDGVNNQRLARVGLSVRRQSRRVSADRETVRVQNERPTATFRDRALVGTRGSRATSRDAPESGSPTRPGAAPPHRTPRAAPRWPLRSLARSPRPRRRLLAPARSLADAPSRARRPRDARRRPSRSPPPRPTASGSARPG